MIESYNVLDIMLCLQLFDTCRYMVMENTPDSCTSFKFCNERKQKRLPRQLVKQTYCEICQQAYVNLDKVL